MKPTLWITVGLPASGKSTFAKQLQEDNPSKVRVVTRDDIRASCGARFEDQDEFVVVRIRNFMIGEWLRAGFSVVCADTNLPSRTQKDLVKIADRHGADHEFVDFTDVPLSVCLERNTERWQNGDTKVPNQAIIKMHQQFLFSKNNLSTFGGDDAA